MAPIIQVKNLAKKYRISHHQGSYLTLRDQLTGLFHHPINTVKKWRETKEEFWALKDIDFDVERGEVLGIIGANGAGKSTLLKILSRITPPTSGKITINGRIASLLEVGTGFHPELTGRENIFLNGAILGMTKKEIVKKFDEIVDFSGIEKFLDTPVKFYSSGMYVRLAFAVAAHMEPDILLIDEVLAVGDAEFQKKCLGKMDEVTKKDGRTILFVSHNMGAISKLCKKVFVLNRGNALHQWDNPGNAIKYYLGYRKEENNTNQKKEKWGSINIHNVWIHNNSNNTENKFAHTDQIIIHIKFTVRTANHGVHIGAAVKNNDGITVFSTNKEIELPIGRYEAELSLPSSFLIPGSYWTRIGFHLPSIEIIDVIEPACSFSIYDAGSHFYTYEDNDIGLVYADCKWKLKKDEVI